MFVQYNSIFCVYGGGACCTTTNKVKKRVINKNFKKSKAHLQCNVYTKTH